MVSIYSEKINKSDSVFMRKRDIFGVIEIELD